MHIDDYHFMIFTAVIYLFMIAFCWTLFATLQKIPKESRVFPNWFTWLFLIPVVGFIFQWIMMPFGIPMALKNHFKTDQNAVGSANILFRVGLAQVVLASIGLFIHVSPVSEIIASLGIILWLSYWFFILRFKKKYLSA